MRVELVCVALATLAASFPSLSDGEPLNVLSAPNVLRVGSKENVFVEVQDGSGGPIPVTVMVKDHPSKLKKLFETEIQLGGNNNFQKLVEIFIPEANYVNLDSRQKEYVYLQAVFPNNQLLEKVVLVSFQSGYIFVQTDKPLYTPGSTVFYRALVVTPRLEPLTKEIRDANDISVSIDFVTTDNITIHRKTVNPNMGMISENYKLPEIVSPGVWKVLGRFQSTPQRTFTAEFEVKEYVLPSFEIKIEPRKAFFYVNDEDLSADISARYLFGKEVNGVAYVVFGVYKDGSRKTFSTSLQRVEVRNGKGEATLKREDILKFYPNIDDLISHPLFISVKVLTESGGEMVEAERGGIKVVKSPYTIHFKHTPQYFKPGMPFNIKVYVTNPDNSPAKGLKLEISPGGGSTLTKDNGFATAKVNTAGSSLTITVKTNDPDIGLDKQASRSMQATAYQSPSNNLLHLSVGTDENSLEITMTFSGGVPNADVTILILSRGQLVRSEKWRRVNNAQILSNNLVISKDMLPSFRVVAYYHVGSSEVVSDSVWVELKTSCMGTLKVEATRPVQSYHPGENFELKITGDPGAKVGLVAVDKGVIVLNNKHRLTQKKVWDVVEKYDTGCTAGSGEDSMGVFYDAGLMFQTNTKTGTKIRTEPSCSVGARRKRAVTIFQVRNQLESKYSNALERECCVAGMKKTTLDYSCKRRSEFVSDGTACVNAFLYCCVQMEEERKKHTHGELDLARSAEDDASYLSPDRITSRTRFPESWLWKEMTLPNCPGSTKCQTTSTTTLSAMQDSITTWQITAVSLSKDNGVCVTEPYEMVVLKDFFIDLRLPYSAVYNEQLEIKAVLHNYRLSPIKVRVYLMENENVCSSANKKKSYQRDVTIQASSTLVVPYVIIPMKLGEHDIEVKASVLDIGLRDGITKKLRVVPPGELIKKVFNVELDPSTKPGGKQEEYIKSGVPQNQMPNTPASTEISVTGGVQTNVMVEKVINGKAMGSLIVLPDGCGEQNIALMTLSVITVVYLDTTRQWETVGLERRATALEYMKTGYQRELAYGKPDGSFSVWTHTPGCTWLTAYVTKVFAMASPLSISVDTDVVCNAVKWLILNAQEPSGKFVEKGAVLTGQMIGDVAGLDTETSMTAFVLIAMQEAGSLCDVKVNGMRGSMDKAVGYIQQRLPSVTNPYAVAMASYALANVDKLDKGLLLKFSTGLDHWEVPGGNSIFTLEATGYALLALVKANAMTEAGSVVKWLGVNNVVGSGFASTQATIMVFQSIAKYWSQASTVKEFDLDVDIQVVGRTDIKKYKFNRGNQFVSRSQKVPVNDDLTVKARGQGQATVSVVTLYYAVLDKADPGCTDFDLSVEMVKQGKASYPDAYETYLLKIKIRYKSKERDATMSVLDIGRLTGFIEDAGDLEKLKDEKDRYIEKFESNTVLSERGSLIIYLDKVSHKGSDQVNFRIHSVDKVGVLQPAAVSVYEYYQRTNCRVFYHPQRDDGGLLRLCSKENENICKCAEENCSMQKKLGISNDARFDKACEVTKDYSIDYVYKATVKAMVRDQTTDQYTMTIVEVLKEGTDKDVKGKLRVFIAFALCRESLGLVEGKTYLLMGITRDVYKPKKGSDVDYQYVLGEKTWVEYWPAGAECDLDVYKAACLGLNELAGQLIHIGCVQK